METLEQETIKLSFKEYKKLFNISERTVYNHRDQNRIKISGKTIYILDKDLNLVSSLSNI